MKKIVATILSVLSFGGVLLPAAAPLCAQNFATPTQVDAQTVTPSITDAQQATAPSTALLSPTTYEEYLSLQTPTDVALSGNYTAIADGNTIYLFHRAKNRYYAYEHLKKVGKLQFDLSERLYFLDDGMQTYVLEPEKLTEGQPCATLLPIVCTTFLIEGENVYYTTEAGKAKINQTTLTELNNPVVQSKTLVEDVTPGPTLFFYGNKLYYTSGRELWLYDPQIQDKVFVALFEQVQKISALSIYNGVIFVCSEMEENTDSRQPNFFAYDLAELTQAVKTEGLTPLPTDSEGGYTALTVHGDFVYAVKKDAVRQYDLTKQAFTAYEICGRSPSVHRLDGGTDCVLIGDVLLVADTGNDRLTLYDTKTDVYQTPVQDIPDGTKYLASDGETALAANGNQAVLYDIEGEEYGRQVATFGGFDQPLVGVASVYGKYYFATAEYRYVAEYTEEGWTLSQPYPANVTATLLTADAYGQLYVAGGGCVYKYSEGQFLSDESRQTVSEDFQTAEKLLVDYAGGLYAQREGKLQKVGEEFYPLNDPLVYSDQAQIQSFAFGIEDNVTYVLYKENYIAKTDLLQLPTVKNIAVDGADESIFAKESAVFEVVEIQPNALVIRFDVHSLSGAELFPYTSYERRKQAFVALKIGETAPYNVLAVYDEQAQEYFTCITLTEFCHSADAYCTAYQENKTGYLTNQVTLYKFPYLTDLLTVTRLESGQPITLLGEIEKLDYAYYHVQITDQEGKVQTGYIPRVYVTEFDGAPPTPETLTVGNPTDGMDLLWRFLYLTLGVGVILLLIDVLILKKRKSEEDDDQNA